MEQAASALSRSMSLDSSSAHSGVLYSISIKDLVESSRTVRHSHRLRWEGGGGHLWESTNCSVYSFHGRQIPVELMWNDDLAHSVTGDWRQLRASGIRRGAAHGPKAASCADGAGTVSSR